MFNGIPSGPPQSPIGNQQTRFNPNVSSNEQTNSPASMTIHQALLQELHQLGVTPGVSIRQLPSESRQESQQPNQINIPYAHTG